MIALELLAATGGFIIGASRVGDRLLTGSMQWQDLTTDSYGITVTRGGAASGPVVSPGTGTLAASFIDGPDPLADPAVRPGRVIRLTADGEPLFTGQIRDLALEDRKTDGRLLSTITAADAMASVVNTRRYGAVSDTGQERWHERISRLAQSAQTLVNVPAQEPNDEVIYQQATGTAGWFDDAESSGDWVSRPGGIEFYRQWAEPFNLRPGSPRIERLISGFIPGAQYRITGRLEDLTMGASEMLGMVNLHRLGIDGEQFPTLNPALGPWWDFDYTFTATNDRHQLWVANAANADNVSTIGGGYDPQYRVRVTGLEIQGIGVPDPYRLQDTVFESSLANHFDLACNSVGAAWWIDRHGVVQFAAHPALAPVSAVLTDQRAQPGEVEYTDLKLSLSTRDAINSLAVTNHGRIYDTSRAAWVANNREQVYTSVTGIANWGAISGQVAINLIPTQVSTRAAELLAATDTPDLAPVSVEFNALDHPALAATLDIYSRIEIHRQAQTIVCQVIAIRHEIRPTRKGQALTWLTTLTLRKAQP